MITTDNIVLYHGAKPCILELFPHVSHLLLPFEVVSTCYDSLLYTYWPQLGSNCAGKWAGQVGRRSS